MSRAAAWIVHCIAVVGKRHLHIGEVMDSPPLAAVQGGFVLRFQECKTAVQRQTQSCCVHACELDLSLHFPPSMQATIAAAGIFNFVVRGGPDAGLG